MNKPGIFINYRRDDDPMFARRLGERLTEAMPDRTVFLDIDTEIPLGERFPDVLRRQIEHALVVVAVIGPHWATATDAHGQRRLDQPADWVRHELEMAFANEKKIAPVLFRTAMPDRSQLPASLSALPELQAETITYDRVDADMQRAVARLVRAVEAEERRALGQAPAEAQDADAQLAETLRRKALSHKGGSAEFTSFNWSAALLGNAEAMVSYGYSLDHGQNVAQDHEQAVLWYRRAAELGVPQAMTNLGYAYANGRGVPKDHDQSVAWYRRAAELGHAMALHALGYAHEHGYGVPQDAEQSVAWYRKAARLGNAGSMMGLGLAYQNGKGVPRDPDQALAWYQRAAALGMPGAMHNIGYAYECGQGVPHDLEQAIAWYRRAAALGQARSIAALKRLGATP